MSTIVKNTFFSFMTFGLRFLSSALLFIILARVLEVEEFGRFAFALSFTGIFLVLVDYGFNLLIVKEVAQKPEDVLKIAEKVLSGKIILSFVSTVILFFILKALNYPPKTELVVYILWLAVIFYSFGLFFNTIFRGLNQFQYETYPTVLLNGVQFLLVVIMLILGFETVAIAGIYLISRIIYFLVSLYLVNKKIGRVSLSLDFSDGYKILKESFPYGVHAILATLYFQIDTVFLSCFRGNTEVGYYQAAMKIVMATMIIYEVIVSAYFPVIAEKIKTDIEGFRRNGLALNKYMILVGGVISAFLFLFSEQVIPLIYGKQYANSIIIMQLLAVVIFLRFLGASYAVFITVADNQNLRAIGVAASIVVNVSLNIILIPRYGAVGAAVVSIITHIVLVIIYVSFTLRLIKNNFIDIYCCKGLAFLCIVTFIVYWLKNVILIPSVFVFVLSIILLMMISLQKDEKQLFINTIKKFQNLVVK